VVRFLSSHGIEARWTPAPGLVEEYCVLSSRGEVLTVNSRILGCAAQHLTATALLHQGMITCRVDPELLARIFELDARVMRERLVGTDDLGLGATPEILAAELRSALAAEFLAPPLSGRPGSVRP
jgi:lipoate-protein ligase A